VTGSLEEQVDEIEKRIALIEVRLEQVFEHLNITPRGGAAAGGHHEGEGLDPNDDPEIQDLLVKGNEAQAVKRYRELTGTGIAEAQKAIQQAQSGG
jgi:ribosomal protein L7/L12